MHAEELISAMRERDAGNPERYKKLVEK